MAPGETDPFDLFKRRSLPDEIAVMRAAHPRPTWATHDNLGAMAAFWLERHAMFRELGAAVAKGTLDFREGRIAADPYFRWFAPRINMFLNELHGHHAIEDQHYFPVFQAADARLAKGFEILDADHHVIDGLIHEIAANGQGLQKALYGGGDAARAGDTLAGVLDRALVGLVRHLDDEEDIVIPLILERTEAKLGVR
ncbi:hemerythrin domain-containing protein [Acuticoccus sp. M5D2P5]|uniref:hemerythrin domain-containing protein n=1 Tax=Acuticoccus kalidii TaxID=2910977 RepID=UPI001F159809|nr:hemerythrin domain-containing protein [Acuticoccus kalidii]MCF3933656.1 hemerythrin domain-containing protein [Acuticoccus kalidii]